MVLPAPDSAQCSEPLPSWADSRDSAGGWLQWQRYDNLHVTSPSIIICLCLSAKGINELANICVLKVTEFFLPCQQWSSGKSCSNITESPKVQQKNHVSSSVCTVSTPGMGCPAFWTIWRNQTIKQANQKQGLKGNSSLLRSCTFF